MMMSGSEGRRPMWIVLAIVTPMYFFTMFYRLAPSVLAGDISASLHLNLAELAGISGITWVSYGLMQLPSGLFVDIFGGRRCLFWISLLAAAGNLCFALSQGPQLAAFSRFILGFGCAVLCPCCAVIATSLPPSEYGRANSLFLAFGLSAAAAGDVISLVCLIMLPVQPLVIAISNRCGSRVWVVRVCSVISLVSAVILTVWGESLGRIAIIAAWCGFLLATAYVSSVMYTAIREMFPNRLIGTATGCLQTFPYLIGVPLMQSIFGALVQWREAAGVIPRIAYAEAMWLIVGIIAAGLTAAFLMREPRLLMPEDTPPYRMGNNDTPQSCTNSEE